MSHLQELQQEMQAHLLNQDPRINDSITGPDSETISTRLNIYYNAYRYRLVEVLGYDYKTLQKYIGNEKFFELCLGYIDAYPSKYYSVADFGKHFASFLSECKPYSEDAFLSEFAKFIFAMNSTIDAPDAPILKYEDLTSIPQENWPAMVISLHPSVKTVTTEWNVLPVWQALTEDKTAPPAEKTSALNYIAVWRKSIQPYYVALTEQGAWMLQKLKNGITFEKICEGLLEWYPEEQVAQEAVNLLLQWLSFEMLSTIVIDE